MTTNFDEIQYPNLVPWGPQKRLNKVFSKIIERTYQ